MIPHSLEDSEAVWAREVWGAKTSDRRLLPGEGGRLGARVTSASLVVPEHHRDVAQSPAVSLGRARKHSLLVLSLREFFGVGRRGIGLLW